jgi:hypothetical protein
MHRSVAQEAALEAAQLQEVKIILRRAQIHSPTHREFLATETLVSLVRQHPNRGSKDWQLLCRPLDARLKAFAGGFVHRNIEWPQLARDPSYYVEELAQSVAAELLERSDEPLIFAEVNFGTFFKRKATDFMRKEMRRGRTDDSTPDPEAETDDEHAQDSVDSLASSDATPEELAQKKQWYLNVVRVASEKLTTKEKLALDYHFFHEIPVESIDPEQDSLTRLMKLSPQRIRKILRAAERKLRENLPR